MNTHAPGRHTVRLREHRQVGRPQVDVFTYAADFSNIEHWDPGVVSSTKVTDGPVGVGTRYELEVRFGFGTIPMIYEITVYEPHSRVVLVGRSAKLHAVDEIRFSGDGTTTLIDYAADLAFLSFLTYLTPLMGPVLKKVGTRALDGLAKAFGT
jgi:dehydrogenase/reductase SDR family protein 12